MSLLAEPISAFIESTDPNIWLPAAVCDEFEKAFGIIMDNSTGLYLMNQTHVDRLSTDPQPEVNFGLADSKTGGATVNIVLPFSAFAQPTKYPFTSNGSFYFPLKRAANDSQFTLGRTFLQEA